MSRQERKFGQRFAKALGEGPGPRAVEAQKARLVAEADRQRQKQRRWLTVGGVVGFGLLVVLSYVVFW